MLTNERTTRDEGVGNNPDVEEQEEDIKEEANAERAGRPVANARCDEDWSHSHDVKGERQSTVISSPVVVVSQKSGADGSKSKRGPGTRNRRVEYTVNQASTHHKDGDGTVRHSNGTTNGVPFPDPGNHGAGVSQKGDDHKQETTKAETSQKSRALLATSGQVVTAVGSRGAVGAKNGKDSEDKTNLVPAAILGTHDGPEGIVG